MRLLALYTAFLVAPALPGAELPSAFDIVKPLAFTFRAEPYDLAMDVDAHGDVYIAGAMNAVYDLPDAHRIGPTGNGDMLILKMDALLEHILQATIIGGSELERLQALKIDADGNILIAGYTSSADLPLTNRLRPEQKQGPVILKLNPAGDTLIYGVRLGDSGQLRFLDVDSTGAAYVAGEIQGFSLTTTPGAYLGPAANNSSYPFVLKLNRAGSAVEMATFLSTVPETLRGFAVSRDGLVAFVTQAGLGSLDFTGSKLRFQTPAGELAASLGMDAAGNFYVSGGATENQAFRVQKFSPAGVKLSTSGQDAAGVNAPIHVASDGRVLLTGRSGDPAFPTYKARMGCESSRPQPSGTAGFPGNLTQNDLLAVYAPDGSTVISTAVSEYVRVSALSPDGKYVYAEGLVSPHSQLPTNIGAYEALLRLDLARIPATPPVAPACLASSASFKVVALSPGALMTIYGSGLGPETGASFSVVNGRVPTELSGTTVTVNGVRAPILYAQSQQINFIAPWVLPITAIQSVAEVCVTRGSETVCLTGTTRVNSPSVFQVNGAPMILNQDGTLNGPQHPAREGGYVVMYFTGTGTLDGTLIDGAISGLPLAPASPQVGVGLSCESACPGLEVTYFGSAPGLVSGITQMNLHLPPPAYGGAPRLQILLPDRGFFTHVVNTPVYVKP